LNFWQWAYSDILNNATRGVLAEFIVASAFDLKVTPVREDWAPYDFITNNGISIEVKSSSYIQTWSQKLLSAINFGIRETSIWNEELKSYSDKRFFNKDE